MERKGFTLIEILIVVAIIAILASIVLVGLGPTQQAGRDSRRLSDLREVQNGLELYYNACGYYPGTDDVTPCVGFHEVSQTEGNGSADTYYIGMANVLTGFTSLGISSVPNDPTAGQSYLYATDAVGSSYVLAARLENGNNSVFTGYTAPSDFTTDTTGDSFASDANNCASPYYCITL